MLRKERTSLWVMRRSSKISGVPAVVLKNWMGHTNIHITLDTYADVFNRMNNNAMKKFEDYSAAIRG